MQTFQLSVKARESVGKRPSGRLRRSGFFPAVIYSKGQPTQSVSIPAKEFTSIYKGNLKQNFFLSLNAESESLKGKLVILKDFQLDPLDYDVIHADFVEIHKGEKIKLPVAVKFTGSSAGQKEGGILQISRRELTIRCLPDDIPPFIEVDVTPLKLGESLHVSDLPVSEKIQFVDDLGTVIVGVVSAEKEEKAQEKTLADAAAGAAPAAGTAAAATTQAAPAAGKAGAPASAAKPAAGGKAPASKK